MNFSSSFKNSFKSRHNRRISAGNLEEEKQLEHQPILSDHSPDGFLGMITPFDPHDRREVVVEMDSVDNNSDNRKSVDNSRMRQKSDDRPPRGSNDSRGLDLPQRKDAAEDPPDELIRQFLRKQNATGTETPLDIDLEMDELRNNNFPFNSSSATSGDKRDNSVDASTSREIRVSFQLPSSNVVDPGKQSRDEDSTSSDDDGRDGYQRRRSNDESTYDENNGGDEVVKCTSFQRRPTMLRMKTKSRLIDEPEPDRRSSQRFRASGMMKSGMLGKSGDEEEDDPLFDEDLPEDFKKANFNALTVAQWISLVLIVTSLACTLAIPRWKRRVFRGLEMWKWEVLVLVLICGRLVSGWVIKIVVLLIERNFILRKKVLYFVYGLRKAVQNCIWLGLVLIAWRFFFDRKVDGDNTFLSFVNKFMLWLLVATLLWLLKTLMVKVLASSFHVSTFFDRIQESIFNQYVIETLSGPPLVELQNNQVEDDLAMAELRQLQNAGAVIPPDLRASAFSKSARAQKSSRLVSRKIPEPPNKNNADDAGISIDHLHRLNTKNISAWNMKRLVNIIRHGVLSTIDEQIIDPTKDDSATQIRSEYEAKAAARKIFRNVVRPGSKFIYLNDLTRFMLKDEAEKTMALMEGSPESEKISKITLKNWAVEAFRERKALALTLNDTKTAVNKLHQMVNVLVAIVIIIILLVILKIATSETLLFLSSQVVVVAFIFGNTCKTIFESIIFLFVMHPFDVGDRCEIDGVQMIVEEMNILTTVFLRFDNQKIMYPNSTLSTKPIGNYYRSPDMGDSIDFLIHIATPAEKIALMKQRITSYIENKKDNWYAAPSVVVMNLEGLNSIRMSVWLRHRMNHQNMGDRWQRRAVVIEEMAKTLKELDMEYRLYPLDINVRSLPPTVNSTRFPSTWTAPSP